MLTEERRRILNLLAEGKLDAAAAEKLLDALSNQPVPVSAAERIEVAPRDPKFLRVLVEGYQDDTGAGKVNIRVPFTLIRAGIRLAALLPVAVHEPINRALRENGAWNEAARRRSPAPPAMGIDRR